MTRQKKQLFDAMAEKTIATARESMELLNHQAVAMARRLAPCTCSDIWNDLLRNRRRVVPDTHEFTCEKRKAERVVLRTLR